VTIKTLVRQLPAEQAVEKRGRALHDSLWSRGTAQIAKAFGGVLRNSLSRLRAGLMTTRSTCNGLSGLRAG
jgi:hypothetical protein